jgi:hypothetical protein
MIVIVTPNIVLLGNPTKNKHVVAIKVVAG